jgi:hypothetical protein
MNKALTFITLGSVTGGVLSSTVGGVGISALGGAIGVGFIPVVIGGGLVGLGAYGIYKLGESQTSTDMQALERYDQKSIRDQIQK